MSNTTKILTALCCGAAFAVQASVVDFTAGEGYIDADVTTNANWSGDLGNEVDTAAAGYDGAVGVLNMSTNEWVASTFNELIPMAAGRDRLTAKARFQYTATEVLPAGQAEIISMQIVGVESNGLVRTGLRRVDASGSTILRFWSNGNPNPGNGDSAPESEFGVTGAGDTSDWLEMTCQLTRGTNTSDWIYTQTVTNLTTDTEVLSTVLLGYSPQVGIIESQNLQVQLSSAWRPETGSTTDRKLDRFEVTSDKAPIVLTVIGGAIGNGDFEAEAPNPGPIQYSSVANWHAAGQDDALNFTFTSTMGWSPQPNTLGAMPFRDRLSVNDTGHTVQYAGEVINLNYAFGRVGGGWSGDETNRVYLFTTDVPVDANISGTDMTAVPGAEHLFAVPTNTTMFTNLIDQKGLYTTTTNDIGKTFYLCVQFLDPDQAADIFPRVDVFNLTVQLPEDAFTLYELFENAYELVEGPEGDDDIDGESNWYEYVFGGDPTNAAVMGTQPRMDGADHILTIRSDPSLSYSILSKSDLVNDQMWTTNGPTAVVEGGGSLHEITTDLSGAGTQIFTKTIVE